MTAKIIVTTGDAVEGAGVQEYLGVVRGIAVRVPTVTQGFQALGKVLSGNWQAGAEASTDCPHFGHCMVVSVPGMRLL